MSLQRSAPIRRKTKTRGWSYTRDRRRRLTASERFWEKVRRGPGCWEWQGYRDEKGYGTFHVDTARHAVKAHRFAWELAHGPLSQEKVDHRGTCVLHRCDNPSCVRPDHLFLGTQTDNNRDRHAKGRSVMPKNKARGERAGKAKLSNADAVAIRRLHSEGVSQVELGRRFGVDSSNICRLVSGKTYKEVS